MDKIVWIIGSSSGIGFELVKLYLCDANCKVIASSTNAISNTKLNELKSKYPNRLNLENIDVSCEKSVSSCVNKVFDTFGKLDICLYNAGVYEVTNLKKLDLSEFESMININYLGAVRVLKYFLENKKDNNKSNVIFNASLSSYFGLPYGAAYGSSKAALVNFAQSIQPELKLNNINIQIINHGFVKTRLTSKNDFDMPQLMEANEAAKKIYDKLNKPYTFEIYFPFILSKVLRLISLLPYSLSLLITKKFLKPESLKNKD
ncbi:short-chain dehydrogenase [Malaciobacter pacificus]|uniref:Short-chain dehydrogenase/reductase n=1 Tax=Malaciobacter pacificus TaxID=1080223 RepID=A0A5C2H7K5_9BACT|nr:SDR family NAD(P)-dependent oxidoreductase [Malaciobacter pacificus]QEP34319.1 short-chain dehydrogenase/reductase [Malaciobacter pacificus]GGD48030.1 short-chain dehydrogenase [Malaciobacter pacificus]